jgi:hypothetical protein
MKNFQFFLEYESNKNKRKGTRKQLGNHTGNCIAIFLPTKSEQYSINKCYEAASAVFYVRNSDLNWGCVSPEYLIDRCKRISEKQAKEIHPKLFEYLK